MEDDASSCFPAASLLPALRLQYISNRDELTPDGCAVSYSGSKQANTHHLILRRLLLSFPLSLSPLAPSSLVH